MLQCPWGMKIHPHSARSPRAPIRDARQMGHAADSLENAQRRQAEMQQQLQQQQRQQNLNNNIRIAMSMGNIHNG